VAVKDKGYEGPRAPGKLRYFRCFDGLSWQAMRTGRVACRGFASTVRDRASKAPAGFFLRGERELALGKQNK
jgi:hypothetical protein